MSNKNQCMFSVSRNGNNIIIWGCNNPKRLQVMASDPTDSEWFTRFMTGLCSRIGEHINQDTAIYIAFMIEMQRLLELEWQQAVMQNNKRRIITVAGNGLFRFFTYCGILR